MKKFYLALLLTVACTAFNAGAQNYHMVKDINPETDSYPSNSNYATPGYAVVNQTAYFYATDGVHGMELWKSDGTNEGTVMVKDINPGMANTEISNITAFKSQVLFYVTRSDYKHQLWVSDGTEAGTTMIKDDMPSYQYQFSTGFTPGNNKLYFFISDDGTISHLWQTDGTSGGTKNLVDFYTPDFKYGFNPGDLTFFKGNLYFSMLNADGRELWRSDGTPEGTYMVKDVNPGPASGEVRMLTVANGRLYFSGYDGVSYKLWRSNGTGGNTEAVSSGSTSSFLGTGQGGFPVFNHILYLTIYQSPYYDCYSFNTDSASNGLKFIAHQADATGSVSSFQRTVADGDKLFYTDIDINTHIQRLLVTDEHFSGSTVLDQEYLLTGDVFSNMQYINGRLFFNKADNITGLELWSSDGTPAGTGIIKDINPGIYSGNPYHIAAINPSTVLFSASSGVQGNELWKSDGTEASTQLVKDINQTTTSYGGANLYYSSFYKVINDNNLLFMGMNGTTGTEPWKTDGTEAGTFMIKDISPGQTAGISTFTNFQTLNNETYFFDYHYRDTARLWKINSAGTNATPVQTFTGYIDADLFNMAATNTRLYFLLRNNNYGLVLFSTTGNGVSDNLLSTPYIPGYSNLVTLGDKVFFVNKDVNGEELWVSDGTKAGTKMVKDIYPGPFGATPDKLTVMNGKLYFAAEDGTGYHLWVTEGTEAGTVKISDANITQELYTLSFAKFSVAGSKLYFKGNTAGEGEELWVSDGTMAGTHLVKDVNPGAGPATLNSLTSVKGTLFFVENDGTHGVELWETTGTEATTHLVKDITVGSDGSNYQYLVNGNGILYFTINGKLWESDGTKAGTKPVDDNGLKDITGVSYLVAAGNKLYFDASTYKYGNELYVGDAKGVLPLSFLSFNGALLKNDAQLNWKTANEINNSHFNVQRSTGASFTTIGKVDAATQGDGTLSYSFTDANVTALNVFDIYYRLQQVDKDGNTSYSNIIKLSVGGVGITVTPNPAHKTAYVRSAVSINNAVIAITDMNGRAVYTAKQNITAGTQLPVNVSALPAGTYNVSISGNGTMYQVKMVLQ
jgi:ELWxxDGT repeat protein